MYCTHKACSTNAREGNGVDEKWVRREWRVEERAAELPVVAPGFYPPGTSGQTTTTSQGERANIRGKRLKLAMAGIELGASGHIRRHLRFSKLHAIDQR